MLDIQRLALLRDRTLHGDHVKSHSGASGRHHVGDGLQGKIGHFILEGSHEIRVFFAQFLVQDQVLRAPYHEDRDHILLFMFGIVPVVLDQADLGDLFQYLLSMFFIPFHLFGHLGHFHRLALLHVQHQFTLLIIQ